MKRFLVLPKSDPEADLLKTRIGGYATKKSTYVADQDKRATAQPGKTNSAR